MGNNQQKAEKKSKRRKLHNHIQQIKHRLKRNLHCHSPWQTRRLLRSRRGTRRESFCGGAGQKSRAWNGESVWAFARGRGFGGPTRDGPGCAYSCRDWNGTWANARGRWLKWEPIRRNSICNKNTKKTSSWFCIHIHIFLGRKTPLEMKCKLKSRKKAPCNFRIASKSNSICDCQKYISKQIQDTSLISKTPSKKVQDEILENHIWEWERTIQQSFREKTKGDPRKCCPILDTSSNAFKRFDKYWNDFLKKT